MSLDCYGCKMKLEWFVEAYNRNAVSLVVKHCNCVGLARVKAEDVKNSSRVYD